MADLEDKMARPALPRNGDQLFRGDLRDWMNNACLNVMGNGDAFAYKAGYRRGAEVLIEYVGESGRDQDFLVYPIIFLYRHHIELMLKRIIRRAPYLIAASLSEKVKAASGQASTGPALGRSETHATRCVQGRWLGRDRRRRH
jgi:hypothetical protein